MRAIRALKETIASGSREVRRRGTPVDLVRGVTKVLKQKSVPGSVNAHPPNFRSVSYDKVIR